MKDTDGRRHNHGTTSRIITGTISEEERRANFIEFGNYVSPMDFGGAEIVIHGSRRQTDNHRAFAQRLGATAA
jgi:hypothetical protein